LGRKVWYQDQGGISRCINNCNSKRKRNPTLLGRQGEHAPTQRMAFLNLVSGMGSTPSARQPGRRGVISGRHIPLNTKLRRNLVVPAATIDDRQKSVAQRLIELEGELKFITQPGRIPPRAAVIASLRNEIAALRSELADPAGSPGLDAPLPIKPRVKEELPPAPAATPGPSSSRRVTNSSEARNALLLVEKKLSRSAGEKAAIPLSERARDALEMIEDKMSNFSDASKNLNEIETLQVENTLLRTRLEVIFEKKRHLSQLLLALQKGLLQGTSGGNGSTEKKTESSGKKTESSGKKTESTGKNHKPKDAVVYTP
jgi:hypothetical protein